MPGSGKPSVGARKHTEAESEVEHLATQKSQAHRHFGESTLYPQLMALPNWARGAGALINVTVSLQNVQIS